MAVPCSCPSPSSQSDDMLEELREKLDRKRVEEAGYRAFPSLALSPFRPTGSSEKWKELMNHVG